jgi:hypothetical protein
MKLIKQILKWYSIGVAFAILFVGLIVLTENVIHISQPHEYHNIPQIIFGFGIFTGIVAYAGFGQPQSKE